MPSSLQSFDDATHGTRVKSATQRTAPHSRPTRCHRADNRRHRLHPFDRSFPRDKLLTPRHPPPSRTTHAQAHQPRTALCVCCSPAARIRRFYRPPCAEAVLEPFPCLDPLTLHPGTPKATKCLWLSPPVTAPDDNWVAGRVPTVVTHDAWPSRATWHFDATRALLLRQAAHTAHAARPGPYPSPRRCRQTHPPGRHAGPGPPSPAGCLRHARRKPTFSAVQVHPASRVPLGRYWRPTTRDDRRGGRRTHYRTAHHQPSTSRLDTETLSRPFDVLAQRQFTAAGDTRISLQHSLGAHRAS